MSNVEPMFTDAQIRQQICEQSPTPIEPGVEDIQYVRRIMNSGDGWPLKSAIAFFLTQRSLSF